jgi:two-component system, OmpR family, response regulator
VRILLTEDDRPLSHSLRRGLEEDGYAVDVAFDGEEAGFKAENTNYDAIVLDLMLPKEDGFSLLRRWRSRGVSSHILVLTARGGLEDKVRGLDLGADDYMTKPFELDELLARLRALVRRGHHVKSPLIKVFDLEIDTTSHIARRSGKALNLTPREYSLLELLACNRGKVVTRSMIWDHLYAQSEENTSNVIDVFIRYLRKKVDNGFDPPLILTRWGEGYMMRAEDTVH